MKRHTLSILAIVLTSLVIITGCASTQNKEKGMKSIVPEQEAQPGFQEVYRQEHPDSMLALEWLNDTYVYWITESRSADSISYELHIVDVSKGTESLIFERSVAAEHNLSMAVNLLENQLHLFLCDNSIAPTYSKVIFSTSDWRIISEELLNFTQNIFWLQKSNQNIVVGQDIIPNKSGTFNWNIILYPLESPEQFYPLKQFNETRYEFGPSIWSPSGEYFMLANRDAFGMDQFESMAALLAYPKDEWPTALQYDIFKKDGSFAFSITVDFIYKEDGSTSEAGLFWVPGDQIYVASTFYDATLDAKQSKNQVISSSGTIVYEKSYEGDRNYFNGVNFVNGGVYYAEKQGDAIHLMHLSFLTGEVTAYGPIAERDDWTWISTAISPDETYVLQLNRRDTAIRVLELKNNTPYKAE